MARFPAFSIQFGWNMLEYWHLFDSHQQCLCETLENKPGLALVMPEFSLEEPLTFPFCTISTGSCHVAGAAKISKGDPVACCRLEKRGQSLEFQPNQHLYTCIDIIHVYIYIIYFIMCIYIYMYIYIYTCNITF
jgi:hypothetical protein